MLGPIAGGLANLSAEPVLQAMLQRFRVGSLCRGGAGVSSDRSERFELSPESRERLVPFVTLHAAIIARLMPSGLPDLTALRHGEAAAIACRDAIANAYPVRLA